MNQKELDRQWTLIEGARKRGCSPRTAEKFFVEECRRIALYWADAEGLDYKDACLGVVHSILVMLDGCAVGAPAYAVRPINEDGVEGADIAGHGLHHKLHFVRSKSPRRHPRQGERGKRRNEAVACFFSKGGAS